MPTAQTIGARGLAPGRPPDVSGKAGYAQAAEAERGEQGEQGETTTKGELGNEQSTSSQAQENGHGNDTAHMATAAAVAAAASESVEALSAKLDRVADSVSQLQHQMRSEVAGVESRLAGQLEDIKAILVSMNDNYDN